MDNADRQKITLNIDKLLQYTDYEELMEKCLQKELLFIEMKEQIEIYPDEHTRHRKLLEKITHRGPKAFQKFTNILNLSFPDALSILETKYSGLDRSLHDRKFITANPNVPRPQATVMPVMVPSLPARPIGAPRNNITPHLNGAAALPNTVNPAAPVPHCSSCPPIDVGGGLKLEYYTKEINPKRRIRVRQSDRFHTQSGGKVSTYDMKSAKRGVLFLVNIINFKTKPTNTRNGASVDRDNLINLFRQMQFQIIYYEDITKAQFFSLLNTFVKSPFLRGVDCLVFGLLSHGDEHFGRTTVEFHDDMADINDIIEKFSNANCTRLIGKPKIFLFPFCRGPISDPGINSHVQAYTHRVENDSSYTAERNEQQETNVATFSDIKICYGTLPGFQAFRDPNDGSWYIQVLCDVFAEHAHDTELDVLLKIIGNTMSTRRTEKMYIQTSSNTDRGFYKSLFFNPGYYGENIIYV